MMKKILCFLLVCLTFFNLTVVVYGDNVSTGKVTFTPQAKMVEENFNVDQVFDGLQPGDTRSFYCEINNTHPSTTRWYMSNKVLSSLEESDSSGGVRGGAYTYELVYDGPGGHRDLYKREKDTVWVGGDQGFQQSGDEKQRVGLEEATSNLENFFFLDTLNSGEKGTVKLTVSLEGETQGNIYQNTAARIQMNYAVELANNSPNTAHRTAVKTGDENNLLPYYIGMIVAGLLLLYLALDAFTDRLYKKGKG